ncbi:MAG: hypothetical protein Q9162_005508 [Coniocarpon cinnabarinum]
MIIPALEPSIPVNASRIPLPLLPVLQQSKDDSTAGSWSPIIGVVTAIIGNILISFALNTQRYAHVRLEREQNAGNGAEDKSSQSIDKYASVESRIADARARKNKQANNGNIDHDADEEDTTETDALIPKLDSRQSTYMQDTQEDGNDPPDQKPRKNYLRSPLWWVGICLMVLGETGNFLAYGFAPASIVSPLGVVALISNCLVAPLFLHEKFRKRDLAGVIVAVAGTVTIVLSAQGSNPKLGPDEIWSLVKRWEFLAYFGVTLAAIVVLMFLSNKYGAKSILIDLGLVGLFGGYTALSTKGIASLLSYTLWRTLTFPITYGLIAVLASTAILQIKYVNRALQHFDSTRVIPTQFVMFTIFVIVGSVVLYRDFESATAEQGGKFVGGCGLTFLGVWLLTSGRRDDGNGEDDYKLDEERRISLIDAEQTPPVTPRHQITPNMESQPGTTFSTNTFVSAVSQPSSSQFSTPTRPSRSQKTASTSAVPYSEGSSSQLLLTPQNPREPTEGGQGKPRLTPRASLTSLFAPGSFSPLTTPLSSGLSVVVADQRGRLARHASLRGRASTRNSVAFGDNGLLDVSGSRRESRVRVGEELRREAANQSQSRSRDGEGVDALVDERPRVGRGATVEVVGRTSQS